MQDVMHLFRGPWKHPFVKPPKHAKANGHPYYRFHDRGPHILRKSNNTPMNQLGRTWMAAR
jgi:hypothetical protein